MKCECGEAKPCAVPYVSTWEVWRAFWDKHPARAGIKPLSQEAAQRKDLQR